MVDYQVICFPIIGNEAEGITAPNNGYHLFQAAEVLNTQPFSSGTLPVLNFNTINFAVNDTIYSIGPGAFTLKGYGGFAEINTPTNGGGSQSLAITGQGNAMAGGFIQGFIANGNPFSWYQHCDTAPDVCNFCFWRRAFDWS